MMAQNIISKKKDKAAHDFVDLKLHSHFILNEKLIFRPQNIISQRKPRENLKNDNVLIVLTRLWTEYIKRENIFLTKCIKINMFSHFLFYYILILYNYIILYLY